MSQNKIYKFVAISLVVGSAMLTSCSPDPQSPGIEYMPDMYRTPALEPYSGNSNYADSMEARMPADGSIPQGYLPYGIPNTNEGYEMAGNLLKSPLERNDENFEDGKVIYTKYCMHCHGKDGNGDGPTVTAGHPPPPAYSSAALAILPVGKMFHSITYGKNLMGPHASQLNVEERWKVIQYVQHLQNPDGEPEAAEMEEGDENEVEESAVENTVDETAMNN